MLDYHRLFLVALKQEDMSSVGQEDMSSCRTRQVFSFHSKKYLLAQQEDLSSFQQEHMPLGWTRIVFVFSTEECPPVQHTDMSTLWTRRHVLLVSTKSCRMVEQEGNVTCLWPLAIRYCFGLFRNVRANIVCFLGSFTKTGFPWNASNKAPSSRCTWWSLLALSWQRIGLRCKGLHRRLGYPKTKH